jgi:hypothetical protein
VMDLLRKGYKVQMKFSPNGLEHQVVWYPVPRFRGVFPGQHLFGSLIWSSLQRGSNPVGEQGPMTELYFGGEPFPTGNGPFAGERSWFSEGAPDDAPPLSPGSDGFPSGPKRSGSGLSLAGRAVVVRDSNLAIGRGGLLLDGNDSGKGGLLLNGRPPL